MVEVYESRRDDHRGERGVAVGTAAAAEQVRAVQGVAAAWAGGEPVPGALGEGTGDAGACLLAFTCCLEAELRLLQLAARVGQLAACGLKLAFELAHRLRVGDRLKGALEQLDERLGEAEAALVLPDAITTAWAATRGSGDRLVAWRVSPPHGWEVLLH